MRIIAGMNDSYRAVMLTKKGDPSVLETVSLPLAPPPAGSVRVKVHACGVGFTDVIMRRGYYPFAPPKPFVPGYEAVGTVDAVGEGVTSLRAGQRVAALLVHGGYAEYVTREAEHWVPVPDGVTDTDAVALILNYVTAYQMIHREAKVVAGQTALVTGAGGGVGTALLELLRLAGVKTIAAESLPKEATVRALGAEFVDYRARPLDESVRALVPEGVDVAFDGIGGKNVTLCTRALKKGGLLVAYGSTSSVRKDGSSDNLGSLLGMISLFLGTRLRGRRSSFYGITLLYRKDPRPFREDLPKLFSLLAEGKLRPLIFEKLPLLDARRAHEKLEKGGLRGKMVLLAEGAS